MHRDIKPENILINNNGVVKLADFGFAKSIFENFPFTDYISTRWYRAPEILLKVPNYDLKVDIFALGCVFAELMNLGPIFSGEDEFKHIGDIVKVLGDIPEAWKEEKRNVLGFNLGFEAFLRFSGGFRVSLSEIFRDRSFLVVDLLSKMLVYIPEKRISAKNILLHPFFSKEKKCKGFDNNITNFLNSNNGRKYSTKLNNKKNSEKNLFDKKKNNPLNFSQKITSLNTNKPLKLNLSQKSLTKTDKKIYLQNNNFKNNFVLKKKNVFNKSFKNNYQNPPKKLISPLETLRKLKITTRTNFSFVEKNYKKKIFVEKKNFVEKKSKIFPRASINYDSLKNSKTNIKIFDNKNSRELKNRKNLSNPNFFKEKKNNDLYIIEEKNDRLSTQNSMGYYRHMQMKKNTGKYFNI